MTNLFSPASLRAGRETLAGREVQELPWSAEPEEMFAPLAGRPFAQFLDSSQSDQAAGRWSILVSDPFAVLRLNAQQQPFDALRRGLSAYAVSPEWREQVAAQLGGVAPPFLGGAVGLFGYELGSGLERLPSMPRNRAHADMVVGLYDSLLAYDHHEGRVFSVSTGLRAEAGEHRERLCAHWAERWRKRMERAGALRGQADAPDAPVGDAVWRSNFSREEYEAAVARVVRYIRAGDVFQANLSRRFVGRIGRRADAYALYRRLRRLSPAPFAAFLNLDELVVLSSSPERFLENRGGLIRSQPIKGTRPRGATAKQDKANAAALLASGKDRAENVMIVDLLRNDISKSALPHSVDVPRLCALKSYANVHHLVSTVSGRMDPSRDNADLLAGCFPGGSITGAPKLRAMEIIAELERVPRGAYCGAIGYVGFDGEMDTSIAIRIVSLVGGMARGREARFHAGGGVVLDSEPAREYEETIAKGWSLAEALTGAPERIFPEGRPR